MVFQTTTNCGHGCVQTSPHRYSETTESSFEDSKCSFNGIAGSWMSQIIPYFILQSGIENWSH
jgi:hypothetical protein